MFYVDDGLLVGPPTLVAALAKAFMESWTLKIQGMLCSRDFAEHDVFTFSGLEIPVRSELTFLGCKLKRDVAGVFIHQTHWLEAELVKRGLLHLKSSASLPELPEGTILPDTCEASYAEDLKTAQSHRKLNVASTQEQAGHRSGDRWNSMHRHAQSNEGGQVGYRCVALSVVHEDLRSVVQDCDWNERSGAFLW